MQADALLWAAAALYWRARYEDANPEVGFTSLGTLLKKMQLFPGELTYLEEDAIIDVARAMKPRLSRDWHTLAD